MITIVQERTMIDCKRLYFVSSISLRDVILGATFTEASVRSSRGSPRMLSMLVHL